MHMETLEKTGIFDQLLKLCTSSNHDCYVKLIISSFDYSLDALPRKILAKTLTCSIKSSRLYATQFLLVLIRAKVYNFEHWGIELLVNQLFDQSKAISLTALNILHEACEEKMYLEKLVSLKPDLVNLGDKGLLLLIRFLSTTSGFSFLQQSNFIANEISRWVNNFNYRYVRIIEEEMHDCLTLHQRNEDGHYNRRISSVKTVCRRDIFVPPHLYGQLVQHPKGFHTLVELGNLISMFICIKRAACASEDEILELKAALWACGNVATSLQGVDLLAAHNVFAATTTIAKTCPVYALRGTAIYVLGVMSTTYKGANELFKLGWVCTRHDRHERWPVIEGENWDLDSQPLHTESESDRMSENSSMHFSLDDTSKAGGEFGLPYPDDSVTDDELFPTPENVPHPKFSTLPYQASLVVPKHQRSLSESKTIDVLSGKQSEYALKAVNNAHRHRDCSESSTSGVSSCDSMIGKLVISERIQTLSPIPSSSSLSTLKPLSSQVQRRRSDHARRISIQSNAYSDIATVSPTESARLSHQDLLGLTTLRILRQNRKPTNFDGTGDELSSLVRVGSEKVKLGSSLGSRSLKERSLDRQFTHFSFTDFEGGSTYANPILTGVSTSSLTSMTKRTSLLRNSEKNGGPCYMGICMPRNLQEIFPNEKLNHSGVFHTYSLLSKSDKDVQTESPHQVIGKEFFQQISNVSKHEFSTCLNCYRTNPKESIPLIDVFSSSDQKVSEQPSTSQKSFQSTNFIDPRMKIDILKHVERMSNPVWYKPSRQALLHIKQKYPQLFQDICLYSEACKILSSVSMRIMARRFLQELFQDINFDAFNIHPNQLLVKKRQLMSNKDLPSAGKTNTETGGGVRPPDDFMKVRFFSSDSAERSSELSGLVQSRDTANLVVVASTSKATVTTGFVIEPHNQPAEEPPPDGGRDLSPTKHVGPVRSPPLASVKEETLSSVENLLDAADRPHQLDLTLSGRADVPPEKVVSPRGHKTSVDSLSLACSKNIFPITTRCQDHVPTIRRSYSFSKCSNSNPPPPHASSAATPCVPIPKANKTT